MTSSPAIAAILNVGASVSLIAATDAESALLPAVSTEVALNDKEPSTSADTSTPLSCHCPLALVVATKMT